MSALRSGEGSLILSGRREVYRVAEVPDREFRVYVDSTGEYAVHDCVDSFHDHLFVGPAARQHCLRDLAESITRSCHVHDPVLELERVDKVLEFPFPDEARRRVECP